MSIGKADAVAICNFIEAHPDRVGQEDWFDFCDLLLDIVARDATEHGHAALLAREYPEFFRVRGD